MRTVALQLSSSHVSIRNIKSRLFVVIKSLFTNDLFFSERVFKNANLMELHESWSCCNTSQSACDELCGQGSAGMSMSSACFGCVALSVCLWDSSTT